MARKANLPLHSNKGRSWDGGGAKSRMLDAATSDGDINSSKASEGFVYMLNDGALRGDYKSPFADIINGTKSVVWNGLSAAKGRNNQVQGVSAEERAAGMTFIEGQQARFPDSDSEEGRHGVLMPMSYIPFQLGDDDEKREKGRVLVASGKRSRNRDYWSGLPYRLLPSGMRLEHWNKLVLWMHDFNIPLATADLFLEDDQLWATDDFQFHRKEIPVLAVAPGFFGGGGAAVGVFDTGVIADLWEEKILNSVSVHIMLTKEDEDNVVRTDEEILFPTSEVIEFSIVTIPGDRESGREQDYHELVDRMVHKGMERSIAQCFVCNDSGLAVPDQALRETNKLTLAAYSGSKFYRSVSVPNGGKKMADFEVLGGHPNQAEPAAADVTEGEQPEVTEAVEQQPEPVVEAAQEVVEEIEDKEIEIPILELVQEIAQDQEALHILANALASVAQFGAPPAVPEQETRTRIKFVGGNGPVTPAANPQQVQQGLQVQQSVEPTTVAPASAPNRTLGAEKERPAYSILNTVHN